MKSSLSKIFIVFFYVLILFSSTNAQSNTQYTIDYELQSDWGNGGMSAIFIQNTGDTVIQDWTVEWEWPGNQNITYFWNANIIQTGNHAVASCDPGFCTINPGETQSFGFNFDYSNTNNNPLTFTLLVDSDPGNEPPPSEEPPSEEPPPEEPPSEEPPSEEPSSNLCTAQSGITSEYVLSQDWNSGGMSSVIIRNNNATAIDNWQVQWTWQGDETITYHWNADVQQTGNAVNASCIDSYCFIGSGQAQSFGFNLAYTQSNAAPELSLYSTACTGSTDDPGNTVPNDRPTSVTDQFNYVLGTQTIGPQYGFTNDTRLVETAKAIRAMGSNILKIALSTVLYEGTSGYEYQYQQLIEQEPSFREVLDMDFSYYLMWVEDSGSWMDNQGLSQQEANLHYQKIYDLSVYLLSQYNQTGKTFMIGNWEGDWQLVYDTTTGTYDSSIVDVNDLRIEGLIDWLNIRQQAIEDAKANTPHENVDILLYVELNHVEAAMNGYERIANAVLPYVNVDLVSYSSYDITSKEENVGYDAMYNALVPALNYLEAQLPVKNNLPFDKRIFIGEYGYATIWFSNPPQGQTAADVQNNLAKTIMKIGLQWGTPFVLYWQMYDNEYDSWLNSFRGFWLIDDLGVKQPIYYTHENFYQQAKTWINDFETNNDRQPTSQEFRQQAIIIIDGL